MKKLIIALTACLSAELALAQGEPFLGEVYTFAMDFCPKGFAPLNGQLLPINQNQALFSLLGTSYGGNGQVNFALPKGETVFTADRKPVQQCIALQGVFPSQN